MILPTRRDLVGPFSMPATATEFLIDNRVFYTYDNCPQCGGKVSLRGLLYRCTRDGCRKSISLFKHTFFSLSKLSMNEVLEMAYYWLCGCSRSSILSITGYSSATVTSYLGYFLQLVSSSLDESDTQIGDERIIMEVDESKFGWRKYNRGYHIEGAWVVGGIERTPQARLFVKVVERRDEEMLADVLGRHILAGSIVHSDCWRGYRNLEQFLDVRHSTVNHSVGFVDETTGTYTNTIEANGALSREKYRSEGGLKNDLMGIL